MADDNIVDFATRAKLISERKEQVLEDDPLRGFFADEDIMDIVMSGLMFIRQTSISETVNIKIDGDEIIIEAKNMVEFDEDTGIETEQILTKTATMTLVDDDGEELPSEILTKDLQRCLEAVMNPMDDEDEPEETD